MIWTIATATALHGGHIDLGTTVASITAGTVHGTMVMDSDHTTTGQCTTLGTGTMASIARGHTAHSTGIHSSMTLTTGVMDMDTMDSDMVLHTIHGTSDTGELLYM